MRRKRSLDAYVGPTWNEVLRFDTDIHPYSAQAAVVTPEPSTYALMVAGLASMVVVARRRKKQTA